VNDVDRWVALSRELEAAQAEVSRISAERDFVLFRIKNKGKTHKQLAAELNLSKQRVGQMLRRVVRT